MGEAHFDGIQPALCEVLQNQIVDAEKGFRKIRMFRETHVGGVPEKMNPIDAFGHVNHARYVELLEAARWQYLEDNDLIAPIHHAEIFHVVTQVCIQYLHPAKMGDVLCVETKIGGRSNRRFRVDQTAFVKGSGKQAIKATVTNAFVDRQGRPKAINGTLLDLWPDLAGAEHRV